MTIRTTSRRFVLLALAGLAIACSSGDARETAAPESVTTSTGVVDSIFPLDEALRRFRDGVPATTELTGGAPSREALVQRFFAALESRDTATLRELVLTRAEFAWLYYPTSTFAREPFYQMPDVTWFLNVAGSEKGITRALERFGGPGTRFTGYECPADTRSDGGLTFIDGCVVELVRAGESRRLRLFGSIVERGGRFKFYSYANDL